MTDSSDPLLDGDPPAAATLITQAETPPATLKLDEPADPADPPAGTDRSGVGGYVPPDPAVHFADRASRLGFG